MKSGHSSGDLYRFSSLLFLVIIHIVVFLVTMYSEPPEILFGKAFFVFQYSLIQECALDFFPLSIFPSNF